MDFVFIDFHELNNTSYLNTLHEYTIIINFKQYIEEILSSYDGDWKQIWSQFLIDYPRCKITLNGENIESINDIANNVNNYITLNNILIMLCNQSSMGFPMEKIMNYHNLIEYEYVLSDMWNSNLHLDIIKNENYNKLTINKRMRIFKFIDDCPITLFYIDIELVFDFNNNLLQHLQNISDYEKYVDDYGILKWKITNI